MGFVVLIIAGLAVHGRWNAGEMHTESTRTGGTAEVLAHHQGRMHLLDTEIQD